MADYVYSHFFASGSRLEPASFSSEHRMSVYLSENPEILTLREDDDVDIIGLEKQWVRSEIGKGRIDFLASYGDSYAVVELKKGILDMVAFNQLKSYMSEDFLLFKGKELSGDSLEEIKWEGVLVGTGIEDDVRKAIKDHNSTSPSIPFAAIILKRYKSNGQFYVITDVFFPNKAERDKSQFFFNGSLVKKTRIVLAMVQDYVDRYPQLTVSALKNVLGSISRSGLPIAEDFDSVHNDSRHFHHFLMGEKNSVSLEDGIVSIQGFWTLKEISTHVDKIKDALGCHYTVVS